MKAVLDIYVRGGIIGRGFHILRAIYERRKRRKGSTIFLSEVEFCRSFEIIKRCNERSSMLYKINFFHWTHLLQFLIILVSSVDSKNYGAWYYISTLWGCLIKWQEYFFLWPSSDRVSCVDPSWSDPHSHDRLKSESIRNLGCLKFSRDFYIVRSWFFRVINLNSQRKIKFCSFYLFIQVTEISCLESYQTTSQTCYNPSFSTKRIINPTIEMLLIFF